MIRNNGYDIRNMPRNVVNRYERVRQITKRYISNAQKRLGLSDKNTARIKSRAISTENRYFENGYPNNDRSLALDMSQYGDKQVARRQYMGFSNG